MERMSVGTSGKRDVGMAEEEHFVGLQLEYEDNCGRL